MSAGLLGAAARSRGDPQVRVEPDHEMPAGGSREARCAAVVLTAALPVLPAYVLAGGVAYLASARGGAARRTDERGGSCVDDLKQAEKEVRAFGCTIISDPGVIPVKFRAPGGTVCEIVPKGRYKRSNKR